MKRVVAVCVIIALILTASTMALMHLLRVSDEMEASLSAIADAIDRDDMPRAAQLTNAFLDQWERSETVVGLFRGLSTYPDLETFFPKNAF